MITPDQYLALERRARQIRVTLIRMMARQGAPLRRVAVVRRNPHRPLLPQDALPRGNPEHPGRDRLILSKGHAVPTQYACLRCSRDFAR